MHVLRVYQFCGLLFNPFQVRRLNLGLNQLHNRLKSGHLFNLQRIHFVDLHIFLLSSQPINLPTNPLLSHHRNPRYSPAAGLLANHICSHHLNPAFNLLRILQPSHRISQLSNPIQNLLYNPAHNQTLNPPISQLYYHQTNPVLDLFDILRIFLPINLLLSHLASPVVNHLLILVYNRLIAHTLSHRCNPVLNHQFNPFAYRPSSPAHSPLHSHGEPGRLFNHHNNLPRFPQVYPLQVLQINPAFNHHINPP
jgi:hypothetical protein